jgi:lipoate-protein ligase A
VTHDVAYRRIGIANSRLTSRKDLPVTGGRKVVGNGISVTPLHGTPSMLNSKMF